MERLILRELSSESQKLFKLRKKVADRANEGSEVHYGKRELRVLYAQVLEDLKSKGWVEVGEEDEVSLSKKGKRKLEKFSEEEKEEKVPQKKSKSSSSSNGSSAEALTKELWKTGEQVWREGLLDSSYLSNNPDKVLCIYCTLFLLFFLWQSCSFIIISIDNTLVLWQFE